MTAQIIPQKLCKTCKKTKPITDFYNNCRKPDGYSYQCKDCHKAYYKTNNYRELHKDRINSKKRKLYHKTKNNPGARERRRSNSIKIKYGITNQIYDYFMNIQKGVCAICGEPPNGKLLVIDHCHETGDVRGLLCTRCNIGLGGLRDSHDMLLKALDYIRNWKHL